MLPIFHRIVFAAHKIAAAYLAWFVIVFVLVVLDLQFGFLSESMRDVLARYPFALDYELMFTALFAVWAIFLWVDRRLSLFSGVAFVVQAGAMALLAVSGVDAGHLLRDMIPWLALGALLIYASSRASTHIP